VDKLWITLFAVLVDILDRVRYNTFFKRKHMSRHHLVVFANYCRDTGFTLVEALKYVGDNLETDAVSNDVALAYESTYEELMQFVKTRET
jgi:hypothetical protein